eukprot:645456-Rhodomonas_salina.1
MEQRLWSWHLVRPFRSRRMAFAEIAAQLSDGCAGDGAPAACSGAPASSISFVVRGQRSRPVGCVFSALSFRYCRMWEREKGFGSATSPQREAALLNGRVDLDRGRLE